MKKVIIIITIIGLIIIASTWCSYNNNTAQKWFNSDSTLTVKFMHYLKDHENDMSSLAVKDQMPENEETLIAYVMTGMGYWNTAYRYPGLKEECIKGLERSIDTLMSDQVRQLSIDSWEYDPLKEFKVDDSHALYLGYLNWMLSLHQDLVGKSKYSSLNDSISDLLYAKMEKFNWQLPSYATRIFFPDNAVILFSLYVNYKARNKDYKQFSKKIENWYKAEFKYLFIESEKKEDTIYNDYGTGSAYILFSLYLLDYMLDDVTANEYVKQVNDKLLMSVATFKGINERPLEEDKMAIDYDRDAGPIVYGMSTTGTGYMLAVYKIQRFEEQFYDIYRTSKLVGGEYEDDKYFYFKRGGFVGNAIMFGILTSNKNFKTN